MHTCTSCGFSPLSLGSFASKLRLRSRCREFQYVQRFCCSLLLSLIANMALSEENVVDESWRVQLFLAVRDANLDFIQSIADEYPNAIHENFCECLDDGILQWESLKW